MVPSSMPLDGDHCTASVQQHMTLLIVRTLVYGLSITQVWVQGF